MVRIVGILVGLGFVGALLISLISGVITFISEPAVETAEHAFHLPAQEVHFASDGPFGNFDRQQLQRGFQVYREVCSACHANSLVAFRDLAALGYSEPEIHAIAQQWPVPSPSINADTGEAATRPSVPADRIPPPYPNEVAARAANNNALPPNLSLITKARHEGAAYVYSLLTGYRDPATYRNEKGEALPEENRPAQGLHFNPYFANLNIAMAPPLTSTGQVTYADGTPATVDQMARDVSAFLVWTAEPKLESRHSTGIAAMIFLLVFTVLAWMAYRNIWAGVKH